VHDGSTEVSHVLSAMGYPRTRPGARCGCRSGGPRATRTSHGDRGRAAGHRLDADGRGHGRARPARAGGDA
jgi:hypothetical protein